MCIWLFRSVSERSARQLSRGPGGLRTKRHGQWLGCCSRYGCEVDGHGVHTIPLVECRHLIHPVRLVRTAGEVWVKNGIESPDVLGTQLILHSTSGESKTLTINEGPIHTRWEWVRPAIDLRPIGGQPCPWVG